MIRSKFKNIAVVPAFDTGITKEFSSYHNGTDWGWVNSSAGSICTVQDGIVVDYGYEGESSGIGYYVIMQHDYDDNTHRFTGYLHLKTIYSSITKNKELKAGDVIGLMGGTPNNAIGKPIYSPHTHLYCTKTTTKDYTWNTMKSLLSDPVKELEFTRLKNKNYVLAKEDGHNFNNSRFYEEVIYATESKEEEYLNMLKQIKEIVKDV